MFKTFSRSGVQFQYPENWELELEETEFGWLASITSPKTAFMIVDYHPEENNPAMLIEHSLTALKESYTDLEADEVVDTIAGLPAVGHNMHFFALDYTNTCMSRAIAGSDGSILMLAQCCDDELETNGEVMLAIFASMTLADDA